MACDSIVSYLTRETGRYLQEDIFRRVVPYSPIIKLMDKDVWPDGMGESISNLTYGRVAPTDAVPTWNDVVSTLTQEGCNPTPDNIVFGALTRTWNLQNHATNGPDFCVENLRTAFAMQKQLSEISGAMAQYTRIMWEIRYRTEYIRLTGRKVVTTSAVAGTSGTAATFPAAVPTSILTQGMLNYWKGYLIRDGAAEGALGKEGGVPILTLMTSPEHSDNLIFLNADIRQDIRWGRPSELLESFGVERSYRGYYHMIDYFAKRFTYSGGVYTEVPAWVTQAATTGFEQVLNPAWLTAPLEAPYIFDRTVMKSRIPKPISNAGGGFRFDPVNYMGDFSFKNILNKTCNPDGSILFPRAVYASGSEPIKPERGVAFMSLRCDSAANAILSCS